MMKHSLAWFLFGCGLLLLGCRQDPPATAPAPPDDALTDSIEALLPAPAPPVISYPGPDPFVGSYRNDPTLEGFERRLEIDSTAGAGYRVRLTAAEVSGERLCRHEVTFERIDTFLLSGVIEGSTLLIHSAEAALNVQPADTKLQASPGLLCPGASIFGWLLPQWTREEGFPDTLTLPLRDEWVAPSFLRDFNAAMNAAGQPDLALRYETEILTRGDYDGDGSWDYAVLLRDTTGQPGLFLVQHPTDKLRLRRIADLDQPEVEAPTGYLGCGLDTEPAGTAFYDWSTQQRFELPGPGIVLQYYEAATVVFYLQGDRWRMVQVTE